MANAMATIYFTLIKTGNKTIDQVPPNLREEVEALINAENEKKENNTQ